jgi:tetratricopeptide (TPR) repeat protein
MKTLRNEQHGFEIDLPADWQPARIPPALGQGALQYGCPAEAFNFVIGPLSPEPALEDTEIEFRLFARDRAYTNLQFARIRVGGKEHLCARYFIDDNQGRRWNKKYMLVFGGIEYTITATCNDPQWLVKREPAWDAIVQSFRLLVPVDDSAYAADRTSERHRAQRREIIEQRLAMREMTGTDYARAYEAVAIGNYPEARDLLEKCLAADPDHLLAHKELAVVLERLGKKREALSQRQAVKRLAPIDGINRVKLADLLAQCGARGAALREAQELLDQQPDNPHYQALKARLTPSLFSNYRLMFLGGLIALLSIDIGLATGDLWISDIGGMRLMLLLPVGCMVFAGPWLRMSRPIAAVLAGALYLFFLMHTS